MGYRRLFIMRKDLAMSPGKLAAQVAHCAEAYWTNLIRHGIRGYKYDNQTGLPVGEICAVDLDPDIYEQYIQASFVKTICEAKNKTHLLKAKAHAESIGLVEGIHFGLIQDNCLTELTPEEENGTTITGIWFCPLDDSVSHAISKKYQLYH